MAHASTDISLVAVKLNEGQVQSIADDTVSLLLNHQLICNTTRHYHMLLYSTLQASTATTTTTTCRTEPRVNRVALSSASYNNYVFLLQEPLVQSSVESTTLPDSCTTFYCIFCKFDICLGQLFNENRVLL